jgi:hypothetical protein
MNYQTHRSAKKNETTSQRKANNPNKVVMNSINTRPLRTNSNTNRNSERMNKQRQHAKLLGSRSLMATKIAPPEIGNPIKFTNNPKNNAYTMERMPVTDGSTRSYTDRFPPRLPKEYLQVQEKPAEHPKQNQTTEKAETTDKAIDIDMPDVLYHPDEITNKAKEPVKEFVPSWLRNK